LVHLANRIPFFAQRDHESTSSRDGTSAYSCRNEAYSPTYTRRVAFWFPVTRNSGERCHSTGTDTQAFRRAHLITS
jgi:hypothetical protein